MDYRQFQLANGAMDTSSSALTVNRNIHGYQPHIMDSSWLKIPKQEPMDDRDDSGINSGNSSPNSESSRDLLNPYTTPPPSVPGQNRPATETYSPPPMGYPSDPLTAMKTMYANGQTANAMEDFVNNLHRQRQSFPQAPNNLLSPPMSEPSSGEAKDEENGNADALQNLQMALKQNSLLAMPSGATKSSSDDGKSDDDSSSQNKTPKSSSKKKNIKCKHCSLTFMTKEDMWDHYRMHIKQEKLLECPRCAFVTEYKHHFEYHLRNHDGSKPFKCQECSYECVSKSMLNSHMKSHSTVYQYQCANCTYVSKYCHSLKQHLRKYNHKPGTVLAPDGSPNPFSVIDVYGTRRGPKLKKQQGILPEGSPPHSMSSPQMPLMNHFMMNAQQVPQLPQFPQFPMLPQIQEQMSQFFNPLLLSNPALLQNLERIARRRQLSNSTEEDTDLIDDHKPDNENKIKQEIVPKEEEEEEEETCSESGALDLSKSNPNKNRRKGPAFKLSPERMYSSDEEDEHLTTMFSNVEVVQEKDSTPKETVDQEKKSSNTMCQYCNIDFHDDVLYSMHMGYHGFNNPFTCNLCGESYPDKVRFFLHIGQKQH